MTLNLNTASLIAVSSYSYYATGATDDLRVFSEVPPSMRQPMKASQYGIHF